MACTEYYLNLPPHLSVWHKLSHRNNLHEPGIALASISKVGAGGARRELESERLPRAVAPRRASIASFRTRRYYAPRLPGNGYRYTGISPGPAASSPRSAGNTSLIWIVNLPLARRNPKVGINEAEAEANVA